MKEVSNEVDAFMMFIVDDRFTYHIINTHRRPLSNLCDVKSMLDVYVFAFIRIRKNNCECPPIRNKESKKQPIGNEDNTFLECGMLSLECP